MFHVGQLVVCVDTSGERPWPITYPVRGQIYTVRGINERGSGIVLEEIVNEQPTIIGEIHFRAKRFRPVDDKAIEIFRQIVADVKDGVPA